jgi:hypothetical protein
VLASDAGFEVDAHRLDLLGRCASCVRRRAGRAAAPAAGRRSN